MTVTDFFGSLGLRSFERSPFYAQNFVFSVNLSQIGKDISQNVWYTVQQLAVANQKKNTEAQNMEQMKKQGAVLLAQSDGCTVWQFRNETGEGTMTTYEVFSGVVLSFNDFHMERFDSSYVADRRLFAIDHCREGRMEYAPREDLLAYTEAGDMKLDLRQRHTGTFFFPSHHYHGLTIAFDHDIAGRLLPPECGDFPATPEDIIARWALGAYPRVVHNAGLSHIFDELYRVPEAIRIPYFRLKTLELLLYLSAMTVPKDEAPPYFLKRRWRRSRPSGAFLPSTSPSTLRRRRWRKGSASP